MTMWYLNRWWGYWRSSCYYKTYSRRRPI